MCDEKQTQVDKFYFDKYKCFDLGKLKSSEGAKYTQVLSGCQFKDERIKHGKYKHLTGLFHYYRALSLRFNKSNYVLDTIESLDSELEKSLRHHCQLAQIYVRHRN